MQRLCGRVGRAIDLFGRPSRGTTFPQICRGWKPAPTKATPPQGQVGRSRSAGSGAVAFRHLAFGMPEWMKPAMHFVLADARRAQDARVGPASRSAIAPWQGLRRLQRAEAPRRRWRNVPTPGSSRPRPVARSAPRSSGHAGTYGPSPARLRRWRVTLAGANDDAPGQRRASPSIRRKRNGALAVVGDAHGRSAACSGGVVGGGSPARGRTERRRSRKARDVSMPRGMARNPAQP